jgi:hypothetical protein
MTTTAEPVSGATTARRTPWHLWAVGLGSLLWNAYGCYDYLMTNLRGEAYLREAAASMKWDAADTDAFIAYYNSMPAWMTAVWAVGVWGALAGSMLLLLRRKLAVPVFAASLIAFVLSVLSTFVLLDAPEAVRSTAVIQAVIFVACLFFVWYAWTMAKRGVLR